MNNALLIPIYEPRPNVIPFLKSIVPSSFTHIVIVNDGSGPKYQNIFDEIASFSNFIVLGYANNRGKGYALKYGISYIKKHFPLTETIITADGDGQHLLKDILRIRDESLLHLEAFILGERDFNNKEMPRKNRAGNLWGEMYVYLETGIKIKDTQTGLRALPRSLFDLAIKTPGDRYEYEQNFLSAALLNAPLHMISISTIYSDESKEGSHWHPSKDSWRLYRVFFTYLIIGLISFLIDILVFSLLYYLANKHDVLIIFLSVITARLISGIFNFSLLFFITYKWRGKPLKNALLYLGRYIVNFAASFAFLYLLKDSSLPLVIWKIIGDLGIFLVNFFLTKLINILWKRHLQKKFLSLEK